MAVMFQHSVNRGPAGVRSQADGLWLWGKWAASCLMLFVPALRAGPSSGCSRQSSPGASSRIRLLLIRSQVGITNQ